MLYKSGQVAELYNITNETLRVWSKAYGDYLSPTAQADTGKQRLYTRDDMAVMALVAEMRGDNLSVQEIALALKSGQRGQPPELDPEELKAIKKDAQLATDPETLQGLLARSQEALEIAHRQLIELQEIKEKNIRIETSLEHVTEERDRAYKQVEQYQKRIDTLTKRIEKLSSDSGETYARGYREGFRDQIEGGKKD